MGLTHHNPHTRRRVPEMMIPDFVDEGGAWAVAVTNYHNKVSNENIEVLPNVVGGKTVDFANQRILLEELYFRGQSKLTFSKDGLRLPDFGQATVDGSRIGVRIIPLDSNGNEIVKPQRTKSSYFRAANMHLIINGEDQGPCVKKIPLDRPLFVTIDVYSTTTGVEIIQSNSVPNLKDLSRETIRIKYKEEEVIKTLPLPNGLIKYCIFRS